MDVKVCTFNLRVDSPSDGINVFKNREDKILDLIRNEDPDIIGFQEAGNGMKKFLSDNLREYVLVGCGRKTNYRGESVPAAYKKDMFELLGLDTFWLSPTPEIPGSVFGEGQSRCPRISVSLTLKHFSEGDPFIFMNTHFDHAGARVLEAEQTTEYLSRKKEKIVLTGDFNALPSSDEIKILTDAKKPFLVDATRNVRGTFHDFGAKKEASKIDYIFTNLEHDPDAAYTVPDAGENGIYYSDHFALLTTVRI